MNMLPKSSRRPSLQDVDAVDALDPGQTVMLRVVVHNAGSARVIDGLLNVDVRTDCDIEPLSPVVKKASDPDWCRELDKGCKVDVACWLTSHERNFTPKNSIVYSFKLQFPRPGTHPVYLRLDGEPDHHRHTRVWITTRETSPDVAGPTEVVA